MRSWLAFLAGKPKTVTRADIERLRRARQGLAVYHHDQRPVDPDWRLMELGQYEAAAERFLHRAIEEDHAAYFRNRAVALICLRRYDDAFKAYEEADKKERSRARMHTRDLAEMGLCLWLADDRRGALPLIRENLILRMQNKLSYGDAAGGASEGLVAFYAGVSAPDDDLKTRATRHFRKVAKRKRHKGWPRPIMHFLLDQASFEDVLLAATETTDLDTAIAHANVDVLCRRQLTEALFYAAVKHRSRGAEQECQRLLKLVSGLPISHLELEWFLARQEVERVEQAPS
jgi:tetratricopeptide (TPR) repeat protein